jgi:membrane protein
LSDAPAKFAAPQLRVEHWLFDLPERSGSRALVLAVTPVRYLYALLRDLARGELGLRAMSLVYTTLFAIVPVVAVAFSVLKAFGYHHELEPVLFEFLSPLGEQGHRLGARIMGFVENVQGTLLGTVGFVFLLYTAVSTVQKIEEALNFTWHVDRPRSLARRATEYLVVLLVVPALAVIAMVMLGSLEASAVVARLSELASGHAATGRTHFAPYALILGMFAFLYVYMPNTRVRPWPAAVGAVVGGLLWGSVGALFTRIVVYSARAAAVYAGFAVVLLFLFWLYLSWLILLVGAQLSFYVQHPEHLRTGHADIPMTGALRERLGVSVMYLLAERFVRGEARWTTNALAERLDVPATVLGEVVSALEAHRLLLTAEDDTLVPARDLSSIRLASVFDAIRHELPDPRRPDPSPVAGADEVARRADEALRASPGGLTLLELVSREGAAG